MMGEKKLPELPKFRFACEEGALFTIQQMREYALAAVAAAEAPQEDFDKWMRNPYTKVLQKSISEDYVPRCDRPEAPRAALPEPVACRFVDHTGDYVYSTAIYPGAELLYAAPEGK